MNLCVVAPHHQHLICLAERTHADDRRRRLCFPRTSLSSGLLLQADLYAYLVFINVFECVKQDHSRYILKLIAQLRELAQASTRAL